MKEHLFTIIITELEGTELDVNCEFPKDLKVSTLVEVLERTANVLKKRVKSSPIKDKESIVTSDLLD